MSWFKRSEQGIQTRTEEKKDIPKGLWYKTPTGKIIETQELADNFYVSPKTNIMFGLAAKNILKFSLMITTLRKSTPILFLKIF